MIIILFLLGSAPSCFFLGGNTRGSLSDGMATASGTSGSKKEDEQKSSDDERPAVKSRESSRENSEKQAGKKTDGESNVRRSQRSPSDADKKDSGKQNEPSKSPPAVPTTFSRGGPSIEVEIETSESSRPADSVSDEYMASEQPLRSPRIRYTSLSLHAGTGILSCNDFYGFNGFTINYRFGMVPQHYFQIYLGGSWAPLQETSKLHQSIVSEVYLFLLGFDYLHFFTSEHTFMGTYLLGGLEFNVMGWDYKNPFYADTYDEDGNVTGNELIESDFLYGLDLHVGGGFNLVQTRYVDLGAEMVPGVILWSPKTVGGFKNDVFSPFMYIKFRLTVNFVLRRD